MRDCSWLIGIIVATVSGCHDDSDDSRKKIEAQRVLPMTESMGSLEQRLEASQLQLLASGRVSPRQKKGGWEMQCWTDGTLYHPVSPIGVFVSLKNADNADRPPEGRVVLSCPTIGPVRPSTTLVLNSDTEHVKQDGYYIYYLSSGDRSEACETMPIGTHEIKTTVEITDGPTFQVRQYVEVKVSIK